jgi:hypothetical protein
MSLLTTPTGRNVGFLTDRIILFTSHTDYSESSEGCEGFIEDRNCISLDYLKYLQYLR